LGSDQYGPDQLIANGSEVYWTTNGSTQDGTIMHAPVTGATAAMPLATGLETPRTLVIDGTTLYFSQSTYGIYSVPLAGGTPTPLLTTPENVNAFGIYDGNIYFQSGTSLVRLPLSGGTPTPILTETDSIEVLRGTPTGLYWLTSSHLLPLTPSVKKLGPEYAP
jgi:hypothetical protein